MDDNSPAGGMTFDIEQIKGMIPHRAPFLLIDQVTQVISGTSALGIKNLSGDEPFFEGHFPDHPIMPGVLIIEAMAQTSAVLVVEATGNDSGGMVYFMSIEQARFRKPVFPGDDLYLHVEKKQTRGRVWKFKGEARVKGDLMAEAVFSAMIMEKQ
ncbi:MAG: 3-hydroxyacyl-ACP dehydratase FabZ [Proteobacteria bacterium]|nr:3-hydroxyacyl-ACP dehydratase FabZ [Pseudomonadota bacterium]